MSKTNAKTGKREDLSHFVRSSWEANFARYLNHMGIEYKYEPDTFYFNKWYKKGAMHYTPDFYLTSRDVYIEIKGRMDSVDRTKLKRMAKHYPHIKIEVVGKDEYKVLEQTYGDVIPNWEFPTKQERNAHKEKVDKVSDELEKEGYSIMVPKSQDTFFDLLARKGLEFRLIKVIYLDKGEELSEEFDIESHPFASHEVWVYRYGKTKPEQHII